jgi:hypothetical protein
MKARLEAIANVMVIVMALAVGYVVLGRLEPYIQLWKESRDAEVADPGSTLNFVPEVVGWICRIRRG